jgi:alkylated DNA repair dioxygenase AlkB
MNYTLHKKFLTRTQCSWILDYAKTHFKNDTRLGWTSSKNQSVEFSEDMEKILSPIIDYTKWKHLRIGLAEYMVGDRLQPHVDSDSAWTAVCNLTDDYDGGEFYLDGKYIPLEMGDVLIFNGNSHLHSVKRVKRGYRASLSVWYLPNKKTIV